ncbi:MAG: phage major capsid protein [Candidatus Parvarchaeum sp.]
MATTMTADIISSSILPAYNLRVRDNVAKSYPGLEFLIQQSEIVDGGAYIVEPIMTGFSNNVGNWGGGVDQLDATFQGPMTNATWQPIYFYGSVTLPDTTWILNRGAGEIVSLLDFQYELCTMSLVDYIGYQIYGNGTPTSQGFSTFQGLLAINTSGADPTGGAYGGLTRAGNANPFWNANIINLPAAGTAGTQTATGYKGTVNYTVSGTGSYSNLSLSALQALLSLCQYGGYRPICLLTDLLGYNAYYALLTNIIRQASIGDVGRQGFTGLMFADLLLIQDDHCPAGSMFAVNNLLILRVWKGAFFRSLPWRQPPNALINIKYFLLIAALTHTRPNTMGAIFNIQ